MVERAPWEREDDEEIAPWGRPDPKKDTSDLRGPVVKQTLKNALGGLDAALTMGAQAVPYIASGLIGAASAPFIGMEEANKFREDMFENGLGLGKPDFLTKEGRQVGEMLSHGIEAAGERIGNQWEGLGETYGTPDTEANKAFFRTLGERGAEAAANFAPIPGGKAVRKLGNAIERRYAAPAPKKPVPVVEPKEVAPWEQMELDLPNGKTVSPYDAKPTSTKFTVDENGIPIRNDLTMDVQNTAAAARGQRDMFNEHPELVEEMQRAVQDQAQRAIDARQAELEFQVKKQAGLDFNAAERARQEQAPVFGVENVLERAREKANADPAVLEAQSRLPGMEERLIDSGSYGKAHQDFMEQSLKKMEGDVESLRAEAESRARANPTEIQDLRLQRIEADLKKLSDSHISSNGPIGRQRGAVDLGLQKLVERALKSGMLENFIRKASETPWNEQARAYNIATTDAVSEAVTLVGPAEFRRLAKSHPTVRDHGPEWDAISNEMTARQIVDFFDNMNTGNNTIKFIPRGQRGAVGRDLQQRVQTQKNRELIPQRLKKNLGLDEWDTLRDKEVAQQLMTEAKDIAPDFGQKSLVSGLNMEVALSNNPLLKFARTGLRDARTNGDRFSRTYITDPKVGLTPLWNKMNTKEHQRIMEVLMEADRKQIELTPRVMDEFGLNDTQKQFALTFRSADDQLLKMGNAAAEAVGDKLTDRRVGHFPGIFTGSYKTLAVVGEGKKKRVVAVIPVDTKAQLKIAKDAILEKYPDVKFIDQGRAGLNKFSKNRYYSDIFSGWKDVLELLGREDPRFGDIQDIVGKALMDASNALYNFNVHELAKKGVVGNEGNKPWKNAKENAEDAFSAIIRYFEEGAMHHSLRKPIKDITDLMRTPEAERMPNATNYLNDYLNKVHRQDTNNLGTALNIIIDEPFRLVPTMSWGPEGFVKGKKAVGFGVGPGQVLKMTGALKNNMSQLFMGWFNGAFTLSQFAQPIQTGLPFMQLAASRIGASPVAVTKSLGKGFAQFMGAFTEKVGGKEIGLDPIQREAFQYAIDRGLFEFSEIEKAYQGTQGTLSRAKDRLAEANMKLGEQATRTPMFMSFVDLLVDAGMEKKKAFEIAENLTQAAMIDYHQWERPMVYSKLGVAGGFAAGLTTFKHGYMSQQAYLGKQLVKPAVGKRGEAVLPILYSTAAMLAFAGITGLPFYSEIDAIYKMITDKFFGESTSIRESVLENNPEWINSGIVSDATNMNWQSKFSSGDMIPDNAFKAISPHLEGAFKIGKAGYDVLTKQDDQAIRNFATAASPASARGVAEAALAKDENGNLIGKDGLPSIYRTPEEWQIRELTGMRSQREAIERDKTWDARLKERADTDRRKDIFTEYKRRLVNDNMDAESQQKLEQEYMNRKGDVRQLLQLWQEVALEKQKTEKERLEGMPNSLRSFNRWDYFNR